MTESLLGARVRFTTGTRAQVGVVTHLYTIGKTTTSQQPAATIRTATNVWSQIPLYRITREDPS